MIIVTFKTGKGEHKTCTYQTADKLDRAICYDHSKDAVIGVWQVG